MAQLIKLQDYVSRYEADISQYSSQYVRLKKQQWDRINARRLAGPMVEPEDDSTPPSVDPPPAFIDKLKGLFRKNEEKIVIAETEVKQEEDPFGLNLRLPLYSYSEEELKQYFLDQLLRFQIKWASSTLTEKSIVDSVYFRDERLKYFLQRLPDSFYLMYQPIFLLKKAPVELDTLLLTPNGIWCISFLEAEKEAVFIGAGEHFWIKRVNQHEKKVLNPVLSANRMGKIIRQLCQLYEVDLPIYKAVVSRTGYIDFPEAPSDLQIVDQRTFDRWLQRLRENRSPVKSMQIRAAKGLLEYCQTTSFRRLGWEQNEEQE